MAMENPTPVPTGVVAPGADPDAAAQNAADDAVEHTPQPNVPEPPAPPVEPTDSHEGMDELRDMVSGLAQTVNTLVETVASMADKDEAPGRVPWYARGGERR